MTVAGRLHGILLTIIRGMTLGTILGMIPGITATTAIQATTATTVRGITMATIPDTITATIVRVITTAGPTTQDLPCQPVAMWEGATALMPVCSAVPPTRRVALAPRLQVLVRLVAAPARSAVAATAPSAAVAVVVSVAVAAVVVAPSVHAGNQYVV